MSIRRDLYVSIEERDLAFLRSCYVALAMCMQYWF